MFFFFFFFLKMFFFFSFLCFPYSFYVFFCFYMCSFDCKCKSLKRLGENLTKQTEINNNKTEQLEEKHKQNNINTGYPALDPTANRYLSGSGWEIYVFFLLFFLCMFSFELFLNVFIRVFSIVNAKA